jgi:thiamine biosynthesis protein ThiI
MRKLLLIKSAPEIFLKGLNRNVFEKKLKDNIKKVLGDLKYEFIVDQSRWFLYSENLDELLEKVKKVFGVAEVCVVTEVEADFDSIKEQALNEIRDVNPGTFKVETNRAN